RGRPPARTQSEPSWSPPVRPTPPVLCQIPQSHSRGDEPGRPPGLAIDCFCPPPNDTRSQRSYPRHSRFRAVLGGRSEVDLRTAQASRSRETQSPGSPPAAPRRRAARRGSRQLERRETLVGSLLRALIRPRQERRRDRQAQGLGGLEVDAQFELRGLLNGQVAGLGALENPVHVGGGAPNDVSKV